jgi:hypothetical protein
MIEEQTLIKQRKILRKNRFIFLFTFHKLLLILIVFNKTDMLLLYKKGLRGNLKYKFINQIVNVYMIWLYQYLFFIIELSI